MSETMSNAGTRDQDLLNDLKVEMLKGGKAAKGKLGAAGDASKCKHQDCIRPLHKAK